MKLAIVGSRTINKLDIGKILSEHRLTPDTIISGGARGVDTLAEKWAKEHGINLLVFKPDYKAHLRGAPIRRNELMAGECDTLLAIWDGKSKGTFHIINYAKKTWETCHCGHLVVVDTYHRQYILFPHEVVHSSKGAERRCYVIV